jgi:hypothetical protein
MYSASHVSGRKRPQVHSENLLAGTGINHKKWIAGLQSEVTSRRATFPTALREGRGAQVRLQMFDQSVLLN